MEDLLDIAVVTLAALVALVVLHISARTLSAPIQKEERWYVNDTVFVPHPPGHHCVHCPDDEHAMTTDGKHATPPSTADVGS